MDRKRSLVIGLGLICAVMGVVWAGRRLPLLLKWRYWGVALAERHGKREAALLLAHVQALYAELYAARRQYAQRGLRSRLENDILPALALYGALLAAGRDQDAALAEIEACFKAAMSPLMTPVRLMARLPDPFPLFKWANRQMAFGGQTSGAWQASLVEDSPDRLAYEIRRCFILDTLMAYGAPELAPLFCKTDDWMMEALPPSIGWFRNRTLGRGDPVCDFDWRRMA